MSEQLEQAEPRTVELRCGNCFFAQTESVRVNQNIARQTVLFCHRYPRRVPDPLSSLPYPVVDPERDWCGEFLENGNAASQGMSKPEQEVDEDATVQSSLHQQTSSGLIVPK